MTEQAKPHAEAEVTAYYKKNLQQLQLAIDSFALAIQQQKTTQYQSLFVAVRNKYKKVEWLVQYYHPETAKSINGAPIPEVEADAPEKIVEPLGLQVLETYLYPTMQVNQQAEIALLATALQSSVTRLQATADANFLTKPHIVDAVRSSFITLQTLGITGYDAALVKSGIQEAAVVLSTANDVLLLLQPNDYQQSTLSQKITSAATYSYKNAADFDAFDRLTFIREYMQPIMLEMQHWAIKNNIQPFNENRFFSAKAVSLFDSDAWNPYYFSINGKKSTQEAMVILGEKLFYDVQLSGNGSRSCASCHQPQKAFTDGLVKATGVDGFTTVARNTPTILNAALQRFQFYDSRVVYLEDQPKDVVENTIEMHGNVNNAAKQISTDKQYATLLQNAIGTKAVTGQHLQQALAAYLQTKVYLNSAFDQYMQGKTQTIAPLVKQGFNIFMGKAKCGTCHFAPLFNGMVPPFYDKMESEIIGVPATTEEKALDADVGKFVLYKSPIHKYAFKTTSVRNAAITAPYMHNGVYKTLEQVISFYNKGGGAGIGYQVPNQTLAPEPLQLSTQEQKAVKAFMESLTDSY
jgi:cytochrome c peroxidase